MRENYGREGGIEEPCCRHSGKRKQEVGWGKDAPCLRVRRPTRRASTLWGRRDVLGGSSERRGPIQGNDASLDTQDRLSSITYVYQDGYPFHKKDTFDVVKVSKEED